MSTVGTLFGLPATHLIDLAAVLGLTAVLMGLGASESKVGLQLHEARSDWQSPYRWALRAVAGFGLFHLFFLALHLLGFSWFPWSVCILLLSALGWTRAGFKARDETSARERWSWGWGDAVALLCLAVLAWVALQRWSVHPDLIYHWGIKARRFAAVEGIDTEFLTRSWNVHTIHPAYPLGVPILFAFTAHVLGEWREAAMVAWTTVIFAAMLASGRQVARGAGSSPSGAQASLALLATGTLLVGVGLQILGGPDWVLAAMPLLAWPAFQAPGKASDRAVGWVAALGAASKMEGIAMAGILITIYGAVRWRSLRDGAPDSRGSMLHLLRRAPALLLPSLVVILAWWWISTENGLFGHAYRGELELRWLGIVLSTMLERLRLAPWHGLGWVLFLLPLCVLPGQSRATKAVGWVLLAQLGVYVYAYLASPYGTGEEVRFYVQSNFARLAFHLIPTLLLAGGLMIDRWLGSFPTPRTPAPEGDET